MDRVVKALHDLHPAARQVEDRDALRGMLSVEEVRDLPPEPRPFTQVTVAEAEPVPALSAPVEAPAAAPAQAQAQPLTLEAT